MKLSTIHGKNFWVAENDYSIELGWDEAITASLKMDKNWRLPTKEELQSIYLNKEVLNIKSDGAYWSSTETNDEHIQRNWLGFSKGKSKNAWLLDFTNGEWLNFVEKKSKFKIRFVKD